MTSDVKDPLEGVRMFQSTASHKAPDRFPDALKNLGSYSRRFIPIREEKLDFFPLWELEQQLLGQIDPTEEDGGAQDGAGSSPYGTIGRIDDFGALSDHAFTIPESTGEGYFKRGFDTHGKKKTLGLALSGGGIRAASFALGVMQGLNALKAEDEKTSGASDLGRAEGTSSAKPRMEADEKQDGTPPPRPPTLLHHVDYMSTVSGGGYAGAALTNYRRLHRSHACRPSPEVDGDKRTANEAGEDKCLKDIDLLAFPKPESEVLNRDESRLLDFTRFRRNHLTPTTNLNFNSLLSVAFANILLAWPIYLAVLTAALIVIYCLAEWLMMLAPDWISVWCHCTGVDGLTRLIADAYCGVVHNSVDYDREIENRSWLGGGADIEQLRLAILAGVFLSAGFVVLLFASTVISVFRGWRESSQYKRRRRNQILSGWILTGLAVTALYLVTIWLSNLIHADPAMISSLVLGGNAIAGVSLVSLREGTFWKRLMSPRVVLVLCALVILLGNMILAYNTSRFIMSPFFEPAQAAETANGISAWYYMAVGFVIVGLLFAWFTSINYVSLTRMYRDRLMEAFMPDLSAALDKDNNRPASDSDRAGLWDCQQRPLHIVNTNVVLSTSNISRYRGRAGDNFILAPHYCGSWVTGYRLTQGFSHDPERAAGGNRPDNGMGLATAMAISGAAFSPRVGPSGWSALLQNPLVASISSLLNLRLGFWVANPRAPDQTRRATFWNAGLRGILNMWFDERRHFIELTDGGHFENTGLFELLRRRVDVIILSDASADRRFNFKDIGIAIERARVDQSVDIHFKWGHTDLTHLMPGSAGETHYDKRYELARRGFAVGQITYPAFKYTAKGANEPVSVPEKKGLLIYIKPTVTRRMRGDIYSYKGAFKDFPYQPITDQHFDESQFEAHRELGFRIAADMVRECEDIIYSELKRDDRESRNGNKTGSGLV